MEFSHDTANALVHSSEQFPIDFDDAWQWVGYSTKQMARKKLINNFEEEIDYVSLNQTIKREIGATTKEIIKLTVDCFKSFCMMAGTAKGKEVRRQYLEWERVAKQQTQPQLTEISERVTALEQAVHSPALPPNLAVQLSGNQPKMCWILQQCKSLLSGDILTIDFPSQPIYETFSAENFFERLILTAHAMGIKHIFLNTCGELQLQCEVAGVVPFALLSQQRRA